MTGYGVKIVSDDRLPDGADWMFVRMKNGELHFWLARSAAGDAQVLAEAWAAYRDLERPCSMPNQQRRQVHRLHLS